MSWNRVKRVALLPLDLLLSPFGAVVIVEDFDWAIDSRYGVYYDKAGLKLDFGDITYLVPVTRKQHTDTRQLLAETRRLEYLEQMDQGD
jgi:hypothetical protein